MSVKLVQAEPYTYGVEQAILASCLAHHEKLAEACGRVVASDFENPFHKRLFTILAGLHQEGRKPSVEAVIAIVGDTDEVSPGVTVRDYLKDIITKRIYALGLPLDDVIETLLDASQRKALSEAGQSLALGASYGTKSVADLATEAVAGIDDVLASTRAQKRKAYAVGEAGVAALALLEGEARKNPTTGLLDLDRMLGGWPRGELSVIAGRPGTGKSAVATACMLKAAKAGHPACFFSLEMHDQQLGARMLADLAYTQDNPIHYEQILNRIALDEHKKRRLRTAQEALKALPIHIDEQRGLTVSEISARARKQAALFAKAGTPLEILGIDHLHIVKASDRYAGNRNRELAEISGGFATLAKELDVAVVALCQLSRAVEGRENKRPSMPDLRESGAIEEDASVIVFLYRAAYYLEKMRFDEHEAEQARMAELNRVRNKIEFGVDKNRNGRVGIVDAFMDIGANALRNGSFAA